jgi:NADH-quinone oxidoreductase subunit G
MPIIYIDNKPYEAGAGKNLLEACLTLGIDLPYFCWHPALGSVGACRQCAVKIFKDEKDTLGKLVMGCMESVRDGLHMSVMDKGAKAFRSQVIEWLMTNHPHDCPVCDEGGSCHLQDMTVMTGHDYRRYHYKKRTYTNQYLGPFIHHEMNRCIQCYRCVRYYHDYAGGNDLNVFAAHNHVYFGREKDGVLQSPFSGNLTEVCPTGVFTDKTLREHYTRKWDLTTAPSVCHHCSLGCNTFAGERYGQLRCITNRYNSQVNGYFLCDRGRFGYEFVNSSNRITQPLIRNRAVEAVDETALMDYLNPLLTNHTVIGIGSPRASVESNFALRQLVGKENFYQGVTDNAVYLQKRIVEILQSGMVHAASLKEIEQSDAVLILGEDIWNTAPVMALAVRQAVMKTAASQALQQTPLPAWHDAAVRELVQEEKGFLANITIAGSPLDDISSTVWRAAPDDIARLGFGIAQYLNPSLPALNNVTGDMTSTIEAIALALQQARRPVIICGAGCCTEAMIRAAFDVAASLNTPGREAGIACVLPECNSLGLAMMQASCFENAVLRVTRNPNITAIVIENDLYRQVPAHVADLFFNSCENIIVLDSLNNPTTQKAHVLIPAATFAEADGTLVNNEGRAQRFYQVFMPANKNMKESWKWLLQMKTQTETGKGPQFHPQEVLALLEKTLPQFAGISNTAPHHNFRINGQLFPRAPHRYSGRTAMLANVMISEPKPLQDDDSPFTFTMEGYQGMPPAPLIPFYWAPGWNSEQSVNKYQQEVGGPLRGGEPGVRLFERKTTIEPVFFKDIPEAFSIRKDKWLLLPQHHVFGSEELSQYTKGVHELSPEPYIALSKYDAERLGVEPNAVISIKVFEQEYTLPVKIDNELCNGIALLPAGLQGMPAFNWSSWVEMRVGSLRPEVLK